MKTGGLKTGIVVATCDAHARTWLPDCLKSLVPLPVHLAWNVPGANHFDPAAVYHGLELGLDEFWVLPDTVVVHQVQVLKRTLASGLAYSVGPGYLSCIGKVRASTIRALGLPPKPQTKLEAVHFELGFMRMLAQLEERAGLLEVLDAGFTDGPAREFRHGRDNMVLETELLTKYKGTWALDMIREPA